MPPNENYARELMQLFTVGIPRLNPDGSIIRTAAGLEHQVYSETDVKELARIFTGWTFGDGNPGDDSRIDRAAKTTASRWKPSARYHDVGAKLFLGRRSPPTKRRSRISIRRSTCSSIIRTSARSSAAS